MSLIQLLFFISVAAEHEPSQIAHVVGSVVQGTTRFLSAAIT